MVNRNDVRMVICMALEESWRLLEMQYAQSDIAFKHVVGFYEFEIASIDHINNTSMSIPIFFSPY